MNLKLEKAVVNVDHQLTRRVPTQPTGLHIHFSDFTIGHDVFLAKANAKGYNYTHQLAPLIVFLLRKLVAIPSGTFQGERSAGCRLIRSRGRPACYSIRRLQWRSIVSALS